MESNIFFRDTELGRAENFLEYAKNIPEPKALVIHASQGSGRTYFLKQFMEIIENNKFPHYSFLNGKYLYDHERNIISKQKTESLTFQDSVSKCSEDSIVFIDDYDETLSSDYKSIHDKDPIYSSPLDKVIFSNFQESNEIRKETSIPKIIPVLVIKTQNVAKVKKHKYATNFHFIKLENYSISEIKKIIDDFPCSKGNDKYKKAFSDYILANSTVINNFSLSKTIELVSARETEFGGKKDLIENVITILSLNSNYSRQELTNIVTMEFDSKQILEDLDKNIILKKQNRTQISNVILMKQLGFSNPNKPVAVIFETGATGTGKTFTAQTVAKIAYGSEKRIIKINMNDFSSGHHVNKLAGSSPGYVGYGEDTFLTKKLKELNPCVVPNTLIRTTKGEFTAEEIYNRKENEKFEFISIDPETEKPCVVLMYDMLKKKGKPCLRITTENGIIECTKNHKLLCRRNSKMIWIEAKDITLEDNIIEL